uniref:Inner membrane protein yhjD n=1 Tax=Propionibacterium freudenreichii TaxID=1744 RepID=A0A2C7ASE7_9ACTN
MFAFSGLGLTLTVIRPALLDDVKGIVVANLYPGPMRDTVLQYLEQYLYHWQTVGLIAIVVALWAGAGWMGNVKSAIRAMWRPEFDMTEDKHFFFVEVAVNALLLLGLIVLVGVLLAANTVFTGWGSELLGLAHLGELRISAGLLRLISLSASLLGGWALFICMFRVLPQTHSSWRSVLRGSAVAAVLFWVMQAVATQLAGVFARNRSAALWGATLIVGLLFLNLFARLLLYVAAWIATANQPAVARRWSDFDQLLRERDDTIAVPDHWAAADQDHAERSAEETDEATASRRAAARAVDVVVGSVMSGLGGPPTDVAGAAPLLSPGGARTAMPRPRRRSRRSPRIPCSCQPAAPCDVPNQRGPVGAPGCSGS